MYAMLTEKEGIYDFSPSDVITCDISMEPQGITYCVMCMHVYLYMVSYISPRALFRLHAAQWTATKIKVVVECM